MTASRSDDSADSQPDMKAAALAYLRAGVAPIPICHPDPRGGFLREDDDGFDPNEPKYRLCVEHRGHRTEKGMNGKAVGKTPLTRYADYEHQLPSAGQVAEWWDRWPAANVAIITGNQYVMFDVDNPEALREAHRRGGLEDAPAQQTGHGCHFACAAPEEELRNFVARERKGFDGRANGGFVIAAPSMHANGKRYEWLAGEIPDFDNLPPLPSWLDEMWRNKPAFIHATGDYEGERLDLDAFIEGIPEGQRNDMLYRYACSLQGQYVKREVAQAAMIGAAGRCVPPYPEDEALAILDRVYNNFGDPAPTVSDRALEEDVASPRGASPIGSWMCPSWLTSQTTTGSSQAFSPLGC